ncbi:hypothetical protein ACHAWU_006490 [Discostella pseudostelligera]|uniref:Uncharacterized protein n=1 Tax=Discostella pseudostelligera TaxID=259834 RepID=A0ABD3MEQ8_9STRA
MDLLKGYGSDSSASSASSTSSAAISKSTASLPAAAASSSIATVPTTTTAAPSNSQTQSFSPKAAQRAKKAGGKRILSLGAVLPPEIFDRLTRQPDDDSSTSSSETERSQSKTRKRRTTDNDSIGKTINDHEGVMGSAGDRGELNSLLNELRSTPLHVSDKITSKNGTSMQNEAPKNITSEGKESDKLGFAFMNYTTTATTVNKNNEKVVDVHAVNLPSKLTAAKSDKPIISSKPTPTAAAIPKFSRMSAAPPVSPFSQKVPQHSQYYMQPPSTTSNHPAQSDVQLDTQSTGRNLTTTQSRKQRREEERALRSGQAFNNPTTAAATEIYQPSPTEFAPTAHAAAIASNAARHRGAASGTGGHSSVKNIAMYDPQSGTDVSGLGVTGKHRSKHQINQLMASAISLEAHRASEAELARFGMGGGGEGGKGSRAAAKRKYGW